MVSSRHLFLQTIKDQGRRSILAVRKSLHSTSSTELGSKANITALPFELCLCINDYLGPEDRSSMRLVSRKMYQRFLHYPDISMTDYLQSARKLEDLLALYVKGTTILAEGTTILAGRTSLTFWFAPEIPSCGRKGGTQFCAAVKAISANHNISSALARVVCVNVNPKRQLDNESWVLEHPIFISIKHSCAIEFTAHLLIDPTYTGPSLEWSIPITTANKRESVIKYKSEANVSANGAHMTSLSTSHHIYPCRGGHSLFDDLKWHYYGDWPDTRCAKRLVNGEAEVVFLYELYPTFEDFEIVVHNATEEQWTMIQSHVASGQETLNRWAEGGTKRTWKWKQGTVAV